MMLARCFIALLIACASASGAVAERRLALIVGIDAYDNLPATSQLKKAVSDARAVAAAFGELGFEVERGENVTRREFYRLWSNFLAKLSPGDMAAFYFSGHGVDIGGNYLMPRDVQPAHNESSLKADAINFRDLLSDLSSKRVSVSFEVLDACRDNPFVKDLGRGIGLERGLGRPDNIEGNFILYSASERQSALDRLTDEDPNPNSVFTRSLLPFLKKDVRLSLDGIAKKVRASVRDLTSQVNYTQSPAYYNELSEDVYLGEKPTSVEAPKPPLSEGAAAWSEVKDSNDINVLEAYRRQFGAAYPLYEALASQRINDLKRQAGNPSPSPAKASAAISPPKKADDVELGPSKLTLTADLKAVETGGVRLGVTIATWEQEWNALFTAAGLKGAAVLAVGAGSAAEAAGLRSMDLITAIDEQAIEKASDAARALHGETARLKVRINIVRFAASAPAIAAMLESKADAGDGSATLLLALMYRNGVGVPKDQAKAIALYRRASDAGNASATATLADLFWRGSDVVQDKTQAIALFKKAAEAGDAHSMFRLGYLYARGEYVPGNDAEAIRYLKSAVQLGDPSAMNELGVMMNHGQGMPRDLEGAMRLYRRAAGLGNKRAMGNLAYMLKNGVLGPPDYQKAIELFKQAAALGDTLAMLNLAAMIDEGVGVSRDPKKAAELVLAALKKGSTRSAENAPFPLRSSDFRRHLQVLLKNEGVYTGPIDGRPNEQLARAAQRLSGHDDTEDFN